MDLGKRIIHWFGLGGLYKPPKPMNNKTNTNA